MPWVRLDDTFPGNRKVAGLTDAEFRGHIEAVVWCARETTDGIVQAEDLDQITPRVKLSRHIGVYVRRRLWHPAGQLCQGCADALAAAGTELPADGWMIHDWLTYNQSRCQVAEERERKAERQRKWREGRRTGRKEDASRDGAVDASRNASRGEPHDGLHDASRDGPNDALVTLAPSPPRPAPKGRAGTTSPQRPPPAGKAADAAADGREEDQTPSGGHPPPWAGNGQPAPPPAELLAAARAKARTASAKTRTSVRQREQGALDALRDATPNIPIPADPDPPPSTPATSDEGQKPEDPTHDQEKNPHAAPAA